MISGGSQLRCTHHSSVGAGVFSGSSLESSRGFQSRCTPCRRDETLSVWLYLADEHCLGHVQFWAVQPVLFAEENRAP